jgi:hypothetical protein
MITRLGRHSRVRRTAEFGFICRYRQRVHMLEQACQMAHGALDGSVDLGASNVKFVGVERSITEEFVPVGLLHLFSKQIVHAFSFFCQFSTPMLFDDIVISNSHRLKRVPRSMSEDLLNED